jgi:hypothetical protein
MSWAIYLTMYGLKGGYAGNTDYVAILILLLAPPVALLLFGLATRWAFHGFRAIESKAICAHPKLGHNPRTPVQRVGR